MRVSMAMRARVKEDEEEEDEEDEEEDEEDEEDEEEAEVSSINRSRRSWCSNSRRKTAVRDPNVNYFV